MRYIPIILFILVLAAPFALQKALVPQSSETGPKAGAERLVIVTPHTSDIRNEFARAFSEWHRDRYKSEVEIDFRVPGGSNDVKRQLEAFYRPLLDSNGQLPKLEDVRADVSMVWGGGDFLFDQLNNIFEDPLTKKKFGILQPVEMPPDRLAEFRLAFPQPALAGVKLYENTLAADGKTPTPKWIGVCLSSFGICFNPDVYAALQLAPPSPEHGWRDLTDPRLAGFLALADPAHSGSVAVAYQMVIQHQMALAEQAFLAGRPELNPRDADARRALGKNPEYRKAIAEGWKKGMSELLKIAANARYFTDSSTLVPMDVSRGEAAAGVSIDFYARVTEDVVGSGRMRFFAPTGATAITPDPVAILYGTKDEKLTLSEHFIEFLLTPQAQRLWNLQPGAPGGPASRSLRRMPVRQDVYRDRTGWADDSNPFETANGFNQRGEWMVLFTDTRPIWVAAWIDSREELREAYGRILRVPDEAKRNALIEELANLPISIEDVAAVQEERKQIEKARGELDEWRAKQQIAWARRFREHYVKIGAEAR